MNGALVCSDFLFRAEPSPALAQSVEALSGKPESFAFKTIGADTYILPQTSGKIKAIKVHHLVPRRHKVTHELLLCVAACIDFRERAELRV